jgi:hypothetical protein
MKIKVNFRILLLFGIFMIFGIICNTAVAQIPSATGIAVKIDTPVDSTNLPSGDLTIHGTSSDDDTTNCQVYADWNDLKPMQNVSANGPKGVSDFSKWSFTYTGNYHNIVEGQNELTSKITCHDSGQNATSKSYSINVTGTQAANENSSDALQQTKEKTVTESNNILPVQSNNNNSITLNDAALQTNKENIINTNTEATNVDTDTEATNVDTDTKATNILPAQSNNNDSTPHQTNEDINNEANNVLPVESNKSDSGTYKILPLYSESNEKSTNSDYSEGSDERNVGHDTNHGTFTALGSQQEGQTEASTSPMGGSEISENKDESEANNNTYFTYEPDLGEDQQSSSNFDHSVNTQGSDNSISNFNDDGNSIFGLKFDHLHKSIDNKLEQKLEKLEDKIADRVQLFDLIG